MRGGELIREARTRAGLTQTELSELTGRDRSVIARWEQGLISPPVESLVACLHACGFDLPFFLVPLDVSRDEELSDSLLLPPSERVERLLAQLGHKRGSPGSGEKNVDGRADPFDPYGLLGALQRRHLSFIVIGAFARVIHGTAEITHRIDITPSLRADNLARLGLALSELDARRADGKPLELHTLDEPVIELQTSGGELKLVPVPAGSRGYDDLRRHASREPLGRGLRPQIASPGDLARMLGALDRNEQIPVLLRLRRLIELERRLSPQRDLGIDL